MSIESIKVPDLGGADSVEVIEICVAVGDNISVDDSIVVLESDKASMEVPSPKAGRVTSIAVKEGDSLGEGALLLELELADSESVDSGTTAVESPATGSSAGKVAVPVPEPEEPATPAPAAGETSQRETVTVPDLGGPEAVTIIEVCVAPGDNVAEGDSLIVLESDKASMEVPSPRAGTVVSVSAKEGDQASPGAAILVLESTGVGDGSPAATASEAPSKVQTPAAPRPAVEQQAAQTAASKSPKKEIPTPSFASTEMQPAAGSEVGSAQQRAVYAGPAVRKLAREMGIALDAVVATGPRQRITKDDLKSYVKRALSEKTAVPAGAGIPAIPAVDFAKFGPIRVEPLSKIHKVTAENMHRSWLNVPHVTQFDEVDITDLEDFRQSLKADAEQRGVKITPLAFLLKAAAVALREHPKFNASLHADGESMVYKDYVHIGLAVDTPAGLMVPVIRDVDTKSVWELAQESAELAQKAKDRKLSPADMQGGCFTISSLGNIGGQGFTPVINTPEVAILGVSRLAVKPVWDGEAFVPRKLLPLALSYDHRAINGADAGRFFTFFNSLLSDIRRLSL